MTTKKCVFLLSIICMIGTKALAYDIAVKNDDGVTIYYNYINDRTELEVAESNFTYSGDINIPEEVTYMDRTRKVTNIGDMAFYCCSELTSVSIPNSVINIGKGAFNGCSNLLSITIPNSVITIGKSAFFECSSLTSIMIPSSVTSIGEWVFYNCSSLTSITVDSKNTKYDSRDNSNSIIETASNKLIIGCQNTTIPSSVVGIGEGAFWGCVGLTSITIPNSVTSIGNDVFVNCSGLTSITIPNTVTSIGQMMFCGCSSLTSITIPNTVTSIGDNAFQECSSLTSITIPNSVTSIGNGAFISCSGLTSITIPSSVTSIGEYAFQYWDIPMVISKVENPFAINANTFSDNTYYNATLYVPAGTIDKYKATEGWNKFTFIEEDSSTSISGIECVRAYKRYSLDGRVLKDSHKGINILQMNNGTIKKMIVK